MRRIGGMSFDEARSAVDSGKMTELQNPWFKAAFMRQYGERLAYERVNELTKEYETNFDKNSGDLDSFIRERIPRCPKASFRLFVSNRSCHLFAAAGSAGRTMTR